MKPIFLIMGSPAAGKSTIANALVQRFERGLHIPVDDLRYMVVSGLSDMSFDLSPTLHEQIRLARETASSMVRLYNDAGFAVAIDDFWHTGLPHADYWQTLGAGIQRILLLPSLEETLNRLHKRNQDSSDMKHVLEQAIGYVQNDIRTHPEATTAWQVIDSSQLGVAQTVDRILELTNINP
jgi:Chloramphenicol phosphotransferase-like protein